MMGLYEAVSNKCIGSGRMKRSDDLATMLCVVRKERHVQNSQTRFKYIDLCIAVYHLRLCKITISDNLG